MESNSLDNSLPYSALSLSTLPDILSLSDFYFYFKNYSNNKIESDQYSSWLNLFNFIAYNISLRKLPFNRLIEELKLFIFINDLHISYSLNVSSSIIDNFLNGIISLISKQDFYNKDENYNSIKDLLTLIFHLTKKSVYNQKYTSETNERFSKVIQVMKDNSKLYETKCPQMYILFTLTNENKYNNQNDNKYFSTPIVNIIPQPNLLLIPTIYGNQANYNNQSKTIKKLPCALDSIPKSHQKGFKNILTGNKMQEGNQYTAKNNTTISKNTQMMKTPKCEYKSINNLLKEAIRLYQSQKSNRFNQNYYEDSLFKLSLIGSNTFGLNTSQSKMDFVIKPITNSMEITLKGILNWMNYKAMNDKQFTYSSHLTLSDNSIIHFSYKEDNVLKESNLYLNEKYSTCNQILKKTLSQGSIASQLHIFFRPLLKFESGIDLIFLIFAFLHFENNVFKGKTKELVYKRGKFNKNNVLIKKEDYCYYYTIKKSRVKFERNKITINTVAIQFLNFYYNLYQRVICNDISYSEKLSCVNDPSFMFSIHKIIEQMKSSQELGSHKNYWDKIKQFKDNPQFSLYTDLIQYFDAFEI